MEASQQLLLDEESLAKVAEAKRSLFVLEWLRFLDRFLDTTKTNTQGIKQVIKKEDQKLLVDQIIVQLSNCPGPPTRRLIATNLAMIFSVGDTFLLFETVNKCNDILKNNKDDSASFLATRLGAIEAIGAMYGKLGRLMGRSHEETVTLLLKSLKNAESQTRFQVFVTLNQIVAGMGQAASASHRDIFKAIKHGMVDRVMAVRSAAACTLKSLITFAPFLSGSDLESVFTLCFRSFDGSNYEVRVAVSHVLAYLASVATSQVSNTSSLQSTPVKQTSAKVSSVEDILAFLSSGFLKGTIGGFLKGSNPVGSSIVPREVRIGVTHTYSLLIRYLGTLWLEKNLLPFMSHVLELLASPKCTSSHTEAVFARKCVQFILSSTIGKLVGEKTQASAIKGLILILNRSSNNNGQSSSSASNVSKSSSGLGGEETHQSSPSPSPSSSCITMNSENAHHVQIAALNQISVLVEQLGTCATKTINDSPAILDTIISLLPHPSLPAVRVAASWSLASVAIASPCHLTPLMDRVLELLESTSGTSAEAISGYSSALAALVAVAPLTPLGIPHNKGKLIFSVAEDLLRSSVTNPRLALNRTQSGWILIGSIMTLGPSVVRGLLPRLLLLWKTCFPKSSKDLESERTRGDTFTWQVTLENRAGALAAMASLITFDRVLVSDEVIKKLLHPLESAAAMLTNPDLAGTFRSAAVVKASAAMVKLRLFEVLKLIPGAVTESLHKQVLTLIVAEFVLSDNPAAIGTSCLRTFVYEDDEIILGSWISQTDHRIIEDQLEPERKCESSSSLHPSFASCGSSSSSSSSSALEHDLTALYKLRHSLKNADVRQSGVWHGPLPLGIALIDSSILLFGHLFPSVVKLQYKQQMLDHFGECIKAAAKGSKSRLEAIQVNVLSAILASLKTATEQFKGSSSSSDSAVVISPEQARSSLVPLILPLVTHPVALIRAAACQAIGRLAQVTSDARFVTELTSNILDRLKNSSKDSQSKSGHSLVLGCIHRHCGSLGTSSQNLNSTIGHLLTLSQDHGSPIVQVWSLHSLAMIADSGGPNFRPYVDPSLEQSLRLLMMSNCPSFQFDVHQSIGKLMADVIITAGPELSSSSSSHSRSLILLICDILCGSSDPLVMAQAISCHQQLHMFAPKFTDVSNLVPRLVRVLDSEHLFLKRSTSSCLHQLTQLDAQEVLDSYDFWMQQQQSNSSNSSSESSSVLVNSDSSSLIQILFQVLDREVDQVFICNIHRIITCCVQSLAADDLASWIPICSSILSSSSSSTQDSKQGDDDAEEKDDEDEIDDDDFIYSSKSEKRVKSINSIIHPRWPTKVFAIQVLKMIIQACELSSCNLPHFDLAAARERKSERRSISCLMIDERKKKRRSREEFLVLHVAELIRMSFMAATSDSSDDLRIEGLKVLQLVIAKFSKVPEPEFPSHVILEQYQAQVGAALRPAFAPETPAHVTAVACQVCSTWIGSGVARDLNDLRRVNQLLVSSLNKLLKSSSNSSSSSSSSLIYNESAITLEKLAILKAWAEVYVTAMREKEQESKEEKQDEEDVINESLLDLVEPELSILSSHWLAALRDHALLTLPPDLKHQLPHEGGSFFTIDISEIARPIYKSSWPPILHAASIWITRKGKKQTNYDEEKEEDCLNRDSFFLLFGIIMESLCSSPKSSDQSMAALISCLESLKTLFGHSSSLKFLFFPSSNSSKQEEDEKKEENESYYSPVIANELLCLLHRIILTRDSLLSQSLVLDICLKLIHVEINNQDEVKEKKKKEDQEVDLVFSLLEIVLCILVRQLPSLSPTNLTSSSSSSNSKQINCNPVFISQESSLIISNCLCLLSSLPSSSHSQFPRSQILPSILFLISGIMKETTSGNASNHLIEDSLVDSFTKLVNLLNHENEEEEEEGRKIKLLLQSSLARILELGSSSCSSSSRTSCLTIRLIGVFATTSNPCFNDQVSNLSIPAIEFLQRGLLDSEQPKVKVTALQVIKSVIEREETRRRKKNLNFKSWIRVLGPKVVLMVKQGNQNQELIHVIKAAIQVLVCIIQSADQDDHRRELLQLVLVILIRNLRSCNQELSSVCLDHILLIGKSPELGILFKEIISRNQNLRSGLEEAVKARQHNMSSKHVNKTSSSSVSSSSLVVPAIKLKTDFSHFK